MICYKRCAVSLRINKTFEFSVTTNMPFYLCSGRNRLRLVSMTDDSSAGILSLISQYSSTVWIFFSDSSLCCFSNRSLLLDKVFRCWSNCATSCSSQPVRKRNWFFWLSRSGGHFGMEDLLRCLPCLLVHDCFMHDLINDTCNCCIAHSIVRLS